MWHKTQRVIEREKFLMDTINLLENERNELQEVIGKQMEKIDDLQRTIFAQKYSIVLLLGLIFFQLIEISKTTF